jgi:poly(hydroxyalkanoate) depolymerase family esterase
VVVLHGCRQTARGYVGATAWIPWADRLGFAVLAPAQRQANNPNGCFSWFDPAAAARDRGEALSIREMVATMALRHRLDPARVFVTGLSAGGAMAGVMLATYPDVFAAGAIIAGLPYGAAASVPEAFAAMRGEVVLPAGAWGDRVRAASRHPGPWPSVAVWHGTADTTVVPANADAVVDQWLDVHGLDRRGGTGDTVDGHPRRVWRRPDGRVAVEALAIGGLAHGTPVDPDREDGGSTAPFVLAAGIASTAHILRFWGLADAAAVAGRPRRAAAPDRAAVGAGAVPRSQGSRVGRIIRKALADAGLLRPGG